MKADPVIHKSSQALADLDEQADHYFREAGLIVSRRFIDNAEKAFDQLAAMPYLGALVGLDELPYEDIRRWHINGFERMIILYRVTADGIEVVRVLNTWRDIAALMRD